MAYVWLFELRFMAAGGYCFSLPKCLVHSACTLRRGKSSRSVARRSVLVHSHPDIPQFESIKYILFCVLLSSILLHLLFITFFEMLSPHRCEACWRLTKDDDKHSPFAPAPKTCVIPGPNTCDICRLVEQSAAALADCILESWQWAASSNVGAISCNDWGETYVRFTFDVPLTPNGVRRNGSSRYRPPYYDFNNDKKSRRLVDLEIIAPFTQPWPWNGFGQADTIHGNSGDDECFVKIRGWLSECLTSHPACSDTSIKGNPKRLIDTGPLDCDPSPRLIDYPASETTQVRYCALSYCWGRGSENFLTTKKSYDARRQGFRIEELPRLFQDVILVTRKLDCRYIWVRSVRARSFA